MAIDHIGAIIFTDIEAFRMIGRLALPIFAYQLAQGYVHTSNYKKYMFRLWIFAIISQIPYTLAFNTYTLNIMFTFVIALFLIDKMEKKEYTWILPILILPFIIPVDYGVYGILLPVAFYLARNIKIATVFLTSIVVLEYAWYTESFITIYAILGIVIALYLPKTKIKLRMSKYFFYWFYPIHLAILFILRMIILSYLI